MSTAELQYCERYQEIVSKCHHDSFLAKLPENLQSLTENEMSKDQFLVFDELAIDNFPIVAQPNLDDAVFCKVNDHVGAVQAGEL